jgi:hypothetical protein
LIDVSTYRNFLSYMSNFEKKRLKLPAHGSGSNGTVVTGVCVSCECEL